MLEPCTSTNRDSNGNSAEIGSSVVKRTPLCRGSGIPPPLPYPDSPDARTFSPRCSARVEVDEHGADSPVVRGGDGESELAHDVANVRLDRVRCDEEPVRDAAVGQALGHQGEDLSFPDGQPVERIALAGSADELRDEGRIDDGLARGDALERSDEVADVEHTVLQQIADPLAGAVEKPERVFGLDVLREQQHSDLRETAAD